MSGTTTEQGTSTDLLTSVTRLPVVLLATDGTAQSDPAVRFVRELSERRPVDVKVLTVVNHLPVPFGGADLQLMADIQREIQRDAMTAVKGQLAARGAEAWPVSLETGVPAERISSTATNINASMIVIGLGGHGLASRLFGSETAVRLVRISEIPVLAIAAGFRPAPQRIVVAMDFSEASIEAARLALDFADKKALVVLAHCVPWSRNEHVPEEWFRSHEAAITAELTRVTRWLDSDRRFRISHRILYGRPAAKLLSYAEEFEADLIVAGTHGRSVLGRVLAGQTVTKVIRGAHCSVLVLPAAAAFKFSDRLPDRTAAGEDIGLRAGTEVAGYGFHGASVAPFDAPASVPSAEKCL